MVKIEFQGEMRNIGGSDWRGRDEKYLIEWVIDWVFKCGGLMTWISNFEMCKEK